MSAEPDVIDTVLGAELAAKVAVVRRSRPVVVDSTQAVHDALFDGPGGRAFGSERLAAVAAHVATLGEAADLAAFYADRAGAQANSGGDAKLTAALQHATRLTTAPATSTRAHVDELLAAGLTETDIVTVAQLTGFVNYQIRLLAGLALIGATR